MILHYPSYKTLQVGVPLSRVSRVTHCQPLGSVGPGGRPKAFQVTPDANAVTCKRCLRRMGV